MKQINKMNPIIEKNMRTNRINNIKHIGLLLAATFMLAGSILISGCSSEANELIVDSNNVPQKQKAGTFTFRLGGTAASSPTSRDVTEESQAFESAIKTIYVPFFTKKADTDESTLNKLYIYEGEVGGSNTITKSDDTYTIGDTDNNKLLSGDFIVYFIANPGVELANSLKAMKKDVTKVTDFKQISIDAKDTPNGGDTAGEQNGTGFLMISDETQVTISSDDATTCTVNMTRLAARFDIINTQSYIENTQPNGATITKVQINNEATQSDLIAPAATSKEDYLAITAEKDWTGTPGDNSDNMTLYTYENITTNASENTSLTITYTLGNNNQEKTLDIYLKERATDTQLGVKRNHLYSIYLNCVTGQYSLEVKDWEEGATVNMPNKDIYVEYTADNLGKIGDYVYNDNGTLTFSDGGLRKMYLNGTLSWTTRPAPTTGKTCIGIVFSNMTSKADQDAGYTHGYVMALKNICPYNGVAWGPKTDAPSGRVTTVGKAILDWDGRTYCDNIKNGNLLSSYPAFNTAMSYDVELPSTGVSGWYLPSIGQIFLIATNLNGMDELRSYSSSTQQLSGKGISLTSQHNYIEGINAILRNIPENDRVLSYENRDTNIVSSNEGTRDAFTYINVSKNNDRVGLSGGGGKHSVDTGAEIRPVFAW